MKFKGTAIFAVVVAAIVGLAVFEFKKGEEEKKTEAVAGHLIKNLATENVEEMSFLSSTQTYKLVQKDNQWSIISPVEDLSDDDIVDPFLRSVATQEIEEVPMEEAVNWSQYGLDKPAQEFILKISGGKEERIQIGSVRPFNEGFYLRINNTDKLYVAQKSLDTYLTKIPNDFRSRRLRIPKGAWTKLSIESDKSDKKNKTEFIYNDKGWSHIQFPEWKLTSSTFGDYERAIKDLKASDVVSDNKSDANLKVHHLQKPQLKVRLATAEKQVEIIFSTDKDGFVFFTATDNPVIYKTASRNVESLYKQNSDFRDKKFPFEFDESKIQFVHIKDEAKKTTIALKKDGLNWVQDGAQAGESVRSGAVDELIKAIKELQINDFPRAIQAARLNNEIELQDATSKTVFKITFGAPYKDKDNEFFQAKTSLSNEIFGVGKTNLQALLDKKMTEVVSDNKEK